MNRRSSSRLFVPACRWFAVALLWAMLPGLWAGETGATPVYTLEECLNMVAKRNPDVLAAAKGIDSAKAIVTQARAGIFPTLSTTGYYQRREQSLSSSGGVNQGIRTDDYTADVRLTQLIFSSFAVRNRIAAAHLTERIANLNYQATLNTVGSQVREAFYTTLAAEASIAVRQQALDLLGSQLKDQQDRLAAGLVGQVNVNRAQVALANEQPPLLEARANIRTSYAALAQLLGIAYPSDSDRMPFRIRGALEVPAFTMTQAECVQLALANRPEVEARKRTLDVLAKQLVVEKAGTRPQVNLFAAYDLYSEPVVAANADTFSGYTLGVAASWSIFDGFATLGRVRGIRAQQGEAAAQLVAIRLQVETEVRTAYELLRSAEGILKPQAKNIALATETLDLTSRNFDAGLGSQLDVLQTRVDLTRTQTQELGGRLSYNTALSRLNRAMAVGILKGPVSPPATTIAKGTAK